MSFIVDTMDCTFGRSADHYTMVQRSLHGCRLSMLTRFRTVQATSA
jgi:hypothetical protein